MTDLERVELDLLDAGFRLSFMPRENAAAVARRFEDLVRNELNSIPGASSGVTEQGSADLWARYPGAGACSP